MIPSSIQQNKLLHEVRKEDPSAVGNYPIKIPNKGYKRYADVALVWLKLDFEYDGKKYHSGPKAKERDKFRDEELAAIGWETWRVTASTWKLYFEGGLIQKIIKIRRRECG